ncbi:VOC family protein [Mesorhizobium sp. 2RAF21]|uniref:VOC family protein n=1 Tax=Mesorhizobium sp. 2RAF21 TaxID=3232995 RepID=UPI003F9D7685
MAHPISDVDHTYLLVHDLEASADHYRRLGFTVSARGLHNAQLGTGNHTIVFAEDYIELLGVLTATTLNEPMRDRLSRYGEGIHAIANRTASADAAKSELAALGIGTGEVSAFSRPLQLFDGAEGIATFRIVHLNSQEAPLGNFFLCQHETPELVWRAEMQKHANGAVGLDAIVGISADPFQTAKTYARLYGGSKVEQAEGGYRVHTGAKSAALLFFDHQAASALFSGQEIGKTPTNGYAALRIRTSDLGRVREVLVARGVPFEPSLKGGVTVGPAHANGAIVEFVVD